MVNEYAVAYFHGTRKAGHTVAVRSACWMKVALSNASGNVCRNFIEVCNTVKESLMAFHTILFWFVSLREPFFLSEKRNSVSTGQCDGSMEWACKSLTWVTIRNVDCGCIDTSTYTDIADRTATLPVNTNLIAWVPSELMCVAWWPLESACIDWLPSEMGFDTWRPSIRVHVAWLHSETEPVLTHQWYDKHKVAENCRLTALVWSCCVTAIKRCVHHLHWQMGQGSVWQGYAGRRRSQHMVRYNRMLFDIVLVNIHLSCIICTRPKRPLEKS